MSQDPTESYKRSIRSSKSQPPARTKSEKRNRATSPNRKARVTDSPGALRSPSKKRKKGGKSHKKRKREKSASSSETLSPTESSAELFFGKLTNAGSKTCISYTLPNESASRLIEFNSKSQQYLPKKTRKECNKHNITVRFRMEKDRAVDVSPNFVHFNQEEKYVNALGTLLVVPVAPTKAGWLYCESNNEMYKIAPSHNLPILVAGSTYRFVGIETEYGLFAENVRATHELSVEEVDSALNRRGQFDSTAKFFVRGYEIDVHENTMNEFKTISNSSCHKRIYIPRMAGLIEKYANAFLNANVNGRIFVGVSDDGVIQGQNEMTRENLDKLQLQLDQRFHDWNPPLMNVSQCVHISTIPVYGRDRMDIENCAVLCCSVENDNDDVAQYLTKDGIGWIRRLASVSKISLPSRQMKVDFDESDDSENMWMGEEKDDEWSSTDSTDFESDSNNGDTMIVDRLESEFMRIPDGIDSTSLVVERKSLQLPYCTTDIVSVLASAESTSFGDDSSDDMIPIN